MQYKQLKIEEREKIQELLWQSASIREIARMILLVTKMEIEKTLKEAALEAERNAAPAPQMRTGDIKERGCETCNAATQQMAVRTCSVAYSDGSTHKLSWKCMTCKSLESTSVVEKS